MESTSGEFMRAVTLSNSGDAEDSLAYTSSVRKILLYPHDLPLTINCTKPTPPPDYLLIRVKTCGIGQIDRRVLKGDLRDCIPSTSIMGYEISGTVEQTGNAVQGFSVGDEVVGCAPLDLGGGYAEYIVLSAQNVVKRPAAITDAEGAALINDGVLAFTALQYKCKVSAGESILILNSATSQGWMCTQLAIYFGCQVLTVGHSKDEVNFLHGNGTQISKVIDLTSEDIFSAVMNETGWLGVDYILQLGPIPTAPYAYCNYDLMCCIASHGHWVTIDNPQIEPPESKLLLRKNASVSFLFEPAWLLAPTQLGRFLHILEQIMELAGKGILKPSSINTYPLERARQAIRELDQKFGKSILRI